jgi:hypothetical protein
LTCGCIVTIDDVTNKGLLDTINGCKRNIYHEAWEVEEATGMFCQVELDTIFTKQNATFTLRDPR